MNKVVVYPRMDHHGGSINGAKVEKWFISSNIILTDFFPDQCLLRRRRKKALLRVNDRGVVGKCVY